MFSLPAGCYVEQAMRPRSSDDPSGDIALDPLPDYAAVDLPADDFGQAPADLDQDVPARRSKTPARKAPPRALAEPPAPPPAVDLVVCLDCGEGPTPSADCPHPEVLHLPEASPAQHAAAQRLAHLTRELRAQQKALRRLASDALGRGEATLTRAALPPGPPQPPQGAPSAASLDGPCPRCGHGPDGPARRRRAPPADPGPRAQGAFDFVAPTPTPESTP